MKTVLSIIAIALAGLAAQAYAASAPTSVVPPAPIAAGNDAGAPSKVAVCPGGCMLKLQDEDQPSTQREAPFKVAPLGGCSGGGCKSKIS